ncbi:MAG: DNA-binding protein WhiA [Lachnospiraceae bacterium]|nr:DNA-binding protein WhiA [Lachnospiraceae bacterium]
MSFSSKIKEELSGQCPLGRHCQIAEIAAIISMCGRIIISVKDEYTIKIHTENISVARKYFTLLKKTYNIDTEISIRRSSKMCLYTVIIRKHEDSIKVLKASKLLDLNGEICENMSVSDNLIIQKECCKRAFIRGAFLATGSVSDPEKFYHYEIVCSTYDKAVQLQKIIQSFNIDAKIVERKKYFVVYIKEGSGIVDILNVMEAHISLMNLENIRILKEMRNSVNRKVNCETANLKKTVSAAVKQIEDIKYIRDTKGLSILSEGLEEVAKLRIENPEASLKELGEMLNPTVGKSGVNHRLRKICEIAEDLRNNLG